MLSDTSIVEYAVARRGRRALGIRAKTSSFHRFHSNTLMSKAKTVGNYVNSILASHEARSGGFQEALIQFWLSHRRPAEIVAPRNASGSPSPLKLSVTGAEPSICVKARVCSRHRASRVGPATIS